MAQPFEFRWIVPESGYEVVETHYRTREGETSSAKHRFLAQKITSETGARAYAPLSNPQTTGLFRRFADLLTEEDFVAFANEFGCMEMHAKGAGSITQHLIGREWPTEPFSGGFQFEFGESIDGWANEAGDMRRLVTLWEAARRNDASTLEDHIHWRSDPKRVEYVSGSGDGHGMQRFSLIAHEETATNYRFEWFSQGARVEPAMFYIQDAVNEKLEGNRSTPRLLWDAEHKDQGLSIHIVPSNLKSALWLQFAHAVAGGAELRQCESCAKWYVIGETARVGSRFCREACRQKAHRTKVAEALRLAETGLSPLDIAERLGSRAKTVRGWLSK